MAQTIGVLYSHSFASLDRANESARAQDEKRKQLLALLESSFRIDTEHAAPDFGGITYFFTQEKDIGAVIYNASLLVQARELGIQNLERYFQKWDIEDLTKALRAKFEQQKRYGNIPLIHFENMLALDPEFYPCDPALIGEIEEYINTRK